MTNQPQISLDTKIEVDANMIYQAYEEIREAKELEIMALKKKQKAIAIIESHLKQYVVEPKEETQEGETLEASE